MKTPSLITDALWFWKRPIPPKLPVSSLDMTDEELGATATDAVGQSLDRARGRYQSKVHLLPPCWRFVYVMTKLDKQVLNGGFHQFFTNARGVFDSHLSDDISMLPDDRLRSVLFRAFERYRKIDYRDQWRNIGRSWDYFSAPYREGRFKGEDADYYALKPAMLSIVGSRVRANWDEYKTA